MKYRYSFDFDSGPVTVAEPLTNCPHCGHLLTEPGGIDIELSVNGQNVVIPSRLDDLGHLVDTDDRAVEKGFHSETRCGHCSAPLTDNESQVSP